MLDFVDRSAPLKARFSAITSQLKLQGPARLKLDKGPHDARWWRLKASKHALWLMVALYRASVEPASVELASVELASVEPASVDPASTNPASVDLTVEESATGAEQLAFVFGEAG